MAQITIPDTLYQCLAEHAELQNTTAEQLAEQWLRDAAVQKPKPLTAQQYRSQIIAELGGEIPTLEEVRAMLTNVGSLSADIIAERKGHG